MRDKSVYWLISGDHSNDFLNLFLSNFHIVVHQITDSKFLQQSREGKSLGDHKDKNP